MAEPLLSDMLPLSDSFTGKRSGSGTPPSSPKRQRLSVDPDVTAQTAFARPRKSSSKPDPSEQHPPPSPESHVALSAIAAHEPALHHRTQPEQTCDAAHSDEANQLQLQQPSSATNAFPTQPEAVATSAITSVSDSHPPATTTATASPTESVPTIATPPTPQSVSSTSSSTTSNVSPPPSSPLPSSSSPSSSPLSASQTTSLPPLRSTPVFTSQPRPAKPPLSSPVPTAISAETNPTDTPKPAPRKKKSVSWAKDDSLVAVEYISNRMDLVRSWDPESQITLPFAPATLHVFMCAIKEQEAAERGDGKMEGKEPLQLRSMPMVSCSFQEARKRETDMEQERARKAREELKKKLMEMKENMPWQRPVSMVLPAECRIDDNIIEQFTVLEEDEYLQYVGKSYDGKSPPSPPQKLSSGFQRTMELNQIPLLPLSETSQGMNHDVVMSSNQQPAPNADMQQQNYDYGYGNMADPSQYRADGRTEDRAGNQAGGSSNRFDNGLQNDVQASSNQATNSVQQLLSRLQSSGLLRNNNNNNNNSNNNRGAKANSRDTTSSTTSDYRPHDRARDERYSGSSDDMNAMSGDRMKMDNKPYPNDESMPPPPPPPPRDDINTSMPPPMGADGGPPPMMGGHQQPMPFSQDMPPGGMDMMGFGMPMGPPGMGVPPNMLFGMGMGMGMGMPMMGMGPPGQMMDAPSKMGGRGGPGRAVETITRPKPKSGKSRKRCKYFGTKAGCRDGNACMFSHN